MQGLSPPAARSGLRQSEVRSGQVYDSDPDSESAEVQPQDIRIEGQVGGACQWVLTLLLEPQNEGARMSS